MDPWDHIRRAVADTRSGSIEVTARAALGLAAMPSIRDRRKAARAVVRAHPAMGALVRLCARVLDDADPSEAARAFVASLRSSSDAAADSVRWITGRREVVVLTHSASGAVARALLRIQARISYVVCTTSLPGGEGRSFAKRLERDGFDVVVIADAEVARACADVDLVLLGADAITPEGVVNKVGTTVVALAAREAGIGCYSIGCSEKMVPAEAVALDRAPAFESTPLELFDAIMTERGPQRPAAVRRQTGRVTIDHAIMT
ncbi:MAG TPA: hypothetical protein VM600_00490, partial [Actinomycetota bacterium]|nr:hypothetical protein [Actinomycetota bacterium]